MASFLDLARAFNKAPHPQLIGILEYYLMKGWMSQFGPILYEIYIDSLLSLEIEGQISSYADNTVLLFGENTWRKTKLKTKQGFEIIECWSKSCNRY